MPVGITKMHVLNDFRQLRQVPSTKTRRCGRWKLENEEAVLSNNVDIISFIHTYRTRSPFGGYACLDFATNEWPMKACVICTDKTSTLTHVVNKLIIVTVYCLTVRSY